MDPRIPEAASVTSSKLIKFTNCRLLRGDSLVKADLWISPETGRVLHGQDVFYSQKLGPSKVIDLGGKILAPGFVETQVNGGFGFDFSNECDNLSDYAKGVNKIRKGLVQFGVTSFLPTITSQKTTLYKKVLPFLKPSSSIRSASQGAEILGAHCEGPFINPCRNGIHPKSVLVKPEDGFASLAECYGADNLQGGSNSTVRLVTIAPELPGAIDAIADLDARGIIASIGHSTTTYEHAISALSAGASTITHLFNAMEPLHHRNPGIFGLLGVPSSNKPFFGLIADGIHLHATCINLAWHAHREGCILVTDAMFAAGLPDGVYDWTNGDRIEKKGQVLHLVDSDGKIAGSASTMIECINNFRNWTGASIAESLTAASRTPARMLGIDGVKGVLEPGADADLVVLDDSEDAEGWKSLKIEQVWKFGEMVFKAD
ncbi:N-acetylglucosamine-6-phosphate deacetylase [Microthyrium microscopicum]|uniref:N-acetylglucosamine-6-phosphate deacetylase n=1 Tax=Microthyrium microscopicum TaxID=703497 RepID=A0A6A6UL22_9PEZI|nr:N-acetylglucosamine-6-phosphate deacetylase [Microthyrium microscopicum]